MSVSLVKRSLDLVSSESNLPKERPAESQDGRKQIPRFKKKAPVDPRKNAAILVQKLREKSKSSFKQNKVEVNVQKLLKLSASNVAHTNKQKKLLRKISKTKKVCPEAKKKKKETSVFTEEDFSKFEKEYFAD